MSPETLARNIVDIAEETLAGNICFTGGEPFLQSHDLLRALVMEINEHVDTIEFFTNGSFLFPPWTKTYDCHFIMDWKLEGSGEASTERSARRHNALHMQEGDVVKFVIKDHHDLLEAVRIYHDLELQGYNGQYWVGKVWDSTEMTDDNMVAFITGMGLPWKLNVQVYKYIWPGVEKGV